MQQNRRKIALYYKAIVCPGGAERLLAKEYQYFVSFGYEVIIVTNELNEEALFGISIPKESIKILGTNNPITSIFKLAYFIRQMGNPLVLCASGHIDIYFASIVAGFRYALHIHHPNYMSFNDFDKYSIFLNEHFDHYTKSNFGAARFEEIRKSLTWFRLLQVNLRAAFSIASVRRSICNFVLSKYAQKEKRDLYKIRTEVLCGALDDNFSISQHKDSKSEVFEVVTLARLDENKRIDVLIEALSKVRKSGIYARLNIIGSGPQKDFLQKLINDSGLTDSVKLLGFVPDSDLGQYFESADLFVSIDWADYKITLFESLARGVPAIVSNETECDPLLLDKGYVRLVNPVADEVSQAIMSFFQSPTSIQPDLIKPILQKYTWGRYFNDIANFLSKTGNVAAPVV